MRNHTLIHFGTLGVDAPSAKLSGSGEDVYKSGTSIATDLAIGIAGALLGYASCFSHHNPTERHDVHSEDLLSGQCFYLRIQLKAPTPLLLRLRMDLF